MATISAPFHSGSTTLRWVENPAAVGLRFVGFADQLASVDHTGWFCDEFRDRMLRGVVYQLPSRISGRARYVYGYTSSDDCPKRGGPTSAALALDDVTDGPGNPELDSTRRDVAGWADSAAEYAAEAERDYNAAWQAGSTFAGIREEVLALEDERRNLLVELRAMTPACKRAHPAAFRAAESRLRDVRTAIADSRETLHKLVTGEPVHRDGCGWHRNATHAAAFLDGAGVSKPAELPRFAASELRPYLSK